jgi:hypothetical protein
MGIEAFIVGSLVASTGSQIMAANEAKQAAQQQRKAQKVETAIQMEQNKKNAVQAMREARIRSAMVQQSAMNTGATGSGQAGTMGSIRSQAGAAIGFQGMQQQAALNQSQFLANASRAQSRAGQFGAAADLFGQLASFGLQAKQGETR